MSLRKYASLENVQVMDLYGSQTKVRHASLGKLADFEQYRTEDGFLYARIRAISSRVNKNHDGWPSIELAGGKDVFDRHTSSEGFTITADGGRDRGFSTFLGKPIFVDHHNSDPSRARGVIVDAKFHVDDHKTSSMDPYYSSSDVDPEHLPGSWVELLLEVDAKSFPKLAKAIVDGGRNPKRGIDGWSMGCDVEKSVCSICKNAAVSPEEYCQHIKMKGAYFDSVRPDGTKTSKKAYENCYGISFFEISAVFDPADETALSRDIVAKTQEETITQDPKEKSLKDVADDQADDFLEETERGIKKRKKSTMGTIMCPNCSGEAGHECPMCEGRGYLRAPTPGGEGDSGPFHQGIMPYTPMPEPVQQSGYLTAPERKNYGSLIKEAPGKNHLPGASDKRNRQYEHIKEDYLEEGKDEDWAKEMAARTVNKQRAEHGETKSSSVHLAENPLPQSELTHAPENIDTLREEEICPVCGSSMDEDTCDVCGYQEPPEGFGNPDLTKAQDVDLPPSGDQGPDLPAPPNDLEQQAPASTGPVNTPNNPTSLASVKSDWEMHTSARINKIEKPLVASPKPQTNEPQEKILADQTKPVTSRVNTAEDFIGVIRRNEMQTRTAEDASAVASPDVSTDVIGVGGVDQASNEEASKADSQVDVLGIGSTGVDSVSAEKEGVNVDQGDEHSKNIEAIHTDTWSGTGPDGDSLGQKDPTTSDTPWWQDNGSGWHNSNWSVEAHDDAPWPNDEIGGGTAVQGNQPIAESFGDRVNVLEHVTSPANNSGPTKTWTGTEGNGVNKQQDPVTNDSIARGESGMEGAPNWTSSTHIFAAFKLADTEVELGLIPADKKYERAAELEQASPEHLAASLQYAQRVKKAAGRKAAGVQKLPVMGRSDLEKEASTKEASVEPSSDDSFMFGA